jgi:hypothetical protein
MMSEEIMKSKLFNSCVVTTAFILILIACSLPGIAQAQSQPATQAQGPKAFDTPQQAAEALIKAAGDYDVPPYFGLRSPPKTSGSRNLIAGVPFAALSFSCTNDSSRSFVAGITYVELSV